YTGFNLLAGDAAQLYYLNSTNPTPRLLGEGVYGLSNAGLNTPWPKLLKARAALTDQLDDPRPGPLLDLLKDPQPAADAELPETGVGLATEKLLS
ncbi:NRDE family protein, partial [Pseudomonas viridiflava]